MHPTESRAPFGDSTKWEACVASRYGPAKVLRMSRPGATGRKKPDRMLFARRSNTFNTFDTVNRLQLFHFTAGNRLTCVSTERQYFYNIL